MDDQSNFGLYVFLGVGIVAGIYRLIYWIGQKSGYYPDQKKEEDRS